MTVTAAFYASRVAMMLRRAPDSRYVRFGSLHTYGTVRETDETVDDGNGTLVTRRLTVVLLASGEFPLLGEGDVISVHNDTSKNSASRSFTVRDSQKVEDGATTRYLVVSS